MYHYLNSKYFDKQNNLLELSEREGVSKISIRRTIKYRQTDRWGSKRREQQSGNAIKCGKVSYNNADMTRYVFRYVISRVPSVTNDCISS